MKQAAVAYDLNYSSFYYGCIKNGGEFQGSGRHTKKLTHQEEMRIVEHVKWRVSIGYGLDWAMLRLLLQELFIAIKQANPTRVTGLEDKGQLSSLSWVRCFAERHNLAGRATMSISKGRQIITPEEIQLWQEDAIAFFSSKPELMDALEDNRLV